MNKYKTKGLSNDLLNSEKEENTTHAPGKKEW